MLRVAIIYSGKNQAWVSCQSIAKNLLAAYDLALQGVDHRPFCYRGDVSNIVALAKEIHRYQPSQIIFVDHGIETHALFRALSLLYGRAERPEVIFHVYGDFTFFASEWLETANQYVHEFRIKLVVASPRQQSLLEKFLAPSGTATVFLCPFPVDEETFSYSAAQRILTRRQMRLEPEDWLVAYTGRLSLQKNISRLIHELWLMWRTGTCKFHLALAGYFDQIGAEFFSVSLPMGYYSQYLDQVISQYPREFRERIHFLGHLSGPELARLHNASDLNASLSLHHDEDFGMAPAEALLCGTPVLLTDWGGYASLVEGEPDSDRHLVKVRNSPSGLLISSQDFQSKFEHHIRQTNGTRERRARSARSARRFSIERVSEILSRILGARAQKFKGFNERLMTLAGRPRFKGRFAREFSQGTFYEAIYQSYIGPT